jgi:hypothetical protein
MDSTDPGKQSLLEHPCSREQWKLESDLARRHLIPVMQSLPYGNRRSIAILRFWSDLYVTWQNLIGITASRIASRDSSRKCE